MPPLPPFVPWEWVRAHRDGVVLAHVAAGAGARPAGAVALDVDADLAAAPSPERGRHPLPSPEAFAATMSRAGIGDGDTVVAFDDEGGVKAARLVWMLRATAGRAALLDGPVGDLSELAGAPRRDDVVRTPVPWPAELLADVDDVLDPAGVVVDARSRERYRGVPDPLDPRPGHVPGARSLPCRELLDRDGRLLPAPELHARFAAAGITADAPVVAYCGSGVTACHDLLVQEHLGLGVGRLHPGSWSQYAADPSRPVALGDDS